MRLQALDRLTDHSFVCCGSDRILSAWDNQGTLICTVGMNAAEDSMLFRFLVLLFFFCCHFGLVRLFLAACAVFFLSHACSLRPDVHTVLSLSGERVVVASDSTAGTPLLLVYSMRHKMFEQILSLQHRESIHHLRRVLPGIARQAFPMVI